LNKRLNALLEWKTLAVLMVYKFNEARSNKGLEKLHKEEIHKFYYSPNIVRVVKLRRMQQKAHEACKRGIRSTYKSVVRKNQGKKLGGIPGCR
jgi:hypothetical protein